MLRISYRFALASISLTMAFNQIRERNVAHAQDRARALEVQAVEPPVHQQAARLQVEVNRPSLIYKVGEVVEATVTTRVSGYLYLIYVHSDNSVNVLFPNEYVKDNEVRAAKTYKIPGSAGNFRIGVTKPLGKGLLKGFVTHQPLNVIHAKKIAKGRVFQELSDHDLADLRQETSRHVGVRADDPKDRHEGKMANILAEHHITITTVEANRFNQEKRALRPPKRFVVAMGVGKQLHSEQIPELDVCTRDATEFASVMKTDFGAEVVLTLLDTNVTVETVRNAFRTIAKQSQPRDEVIIYWSGHGIRIEDTDGDEADHLDEALVPWNADNTSHESRVRTMILDDAFGRWIQDFVGCEVLVIIDACHSGGQADNEKHVNSLTSKRTMDGADFSWAEEFRSFTKDINASTATVLCASTRAQLAHVKKKGDLSVMTDYLLCFLKQQHSRPATVDNLFRYIHRSVEEHVLKQHGVRQTPVLVGKPKSRIVFSRS